MARLQQMHMHQNGSSLLMRSPVTAAATVTGNSSSLLLAAAAGEAQDTDIYTLYLSSGSRMHKTLTSAFD